MILDFFKKRGPEAFDPSVLLCNQSKFFSAEAYKLLRTNLMFTLPDEGKCRVVGISSATRGEGKSITAINLAYVIAESGKKVLLIDADMRLPSVSKKLSIPSAPGLSDLLMTAEPDFSAILKTDKENWDILPAGSIPPNPSELLGSAQMSSLIQTLSENYDFIILDLPPVTIVSDALALSPILHGIALVVRNNYSKRRELHLALKSLELASVKVLGIVINAKANSFTSGFRYKKYARYGYYGRGYYGYGYGHSHSSNASDASNSSEKSE